MRSRVTLAAVAVVVAMALVGPMTATAEPRTFPIGTGYVELTEEHMFEGGGAIQAFIPSGSDRDCLMTLNGLAWDGLEGEISITSFCFGDVNAAGESGAVITLFLHGFPSSPPAGGFVVPITIYQEGAKGYGAPEPYV